MKKTTVSIVRCTDYETALVAESVRRAVDLIGGIGRYVRPGERILLKPNLLGAREPERAVTTHPEVVRAMIRLVKEAGAIPVVGDSPGGAVKGVERVWEKTGMKRIAKEEGVELINFETSGAVEKKIDHKTLRSVHLAKITQDVDGIINLPKLKTHALLIFTGSIKNFYGCIPGLRKAEYHKHVPHPDDFGHLLGEIYLLVKNKVRFTLVDGILGMEGNGPSSGDIRKLDILAASADGVALDTALTSTLGFPPKKIEPLHYLVTKGAGVGDLAAIDIVGDPASAFNFTNFKFPSNWYINLIPGFLVKALGSLLWMKPAIIPELCKGCMLCVSSCPVRAIGQRGKHLDVDMSSCISCLCCHEMCPYHAIDLKSSMISKLLIRRR